jgi:hypothetical protein
MFQVPMSSPQMTRMFGFSGDWADADIGTPIATAISVT